MTRFIALFEDVVKVENAAREAGCKDDESFLDYVEPSDYQIERAFKSKDQAFGWVKRAVKRDMTVFGVGDVYEVEAVSYERRCRWCICGGVRRKHHYIVTEDGIDFEEALDDCADDE